MSGIRMSSLLRRDILETSPYFKDGKLQFDAISLSTKEIAFYFKGKRVAEMEVPYHVRVDAGEVITFDLATVAGLTMNII